MPRLRARKRRSSRTTSSASWRSGRRVRYSEQHACGSARTDRLNGTDAKVDPLLESQFAAGRLYAVISSRPGQSGRADGYVLEGRELEVRWRLASDCETRMCVLTENRAVQFYLRKIRTGKQKHAHAA